MTIHQTSGDEQELTPKGRRFLRHLTAATGGGMFIDGFVFATFAAAFAGRAHDALHVTSLWESWISASVLIGTFFGGIGLGYVTDKVGRKPMFIADLSVFLACAVLMFFVTSPGQVFPLGVIMGLAVGADYSIGSPPRGEFAQARTRGNFLGILEILWNVGYVVAYLIGSLTATSQRVDPHHYRRCRPVGMATWPVAPEPGPPSARPLDLAPRVIRPVTGARGR